ncbi:MAG: hypothetical protein KDN22_03165 [Verrucomicrobiae bacterium]|nr:hypothetical protein [Verrucomicrobiae bacterium]
MSRPTWAVELSAADGESARALRLAPGIEARFTEDRSRLWLRGADLDVDSFRLVRKLPCLRRFTLLEDGRGIIEGKTVPSITLSGSGWVPLRHLSPLLPPTARPCGTAASTAQIRLTPGVSEARAEVLCLPFQTWFEYAIAAPAIRLAPLRFAVSEDGQAIIHGNPLPPLLGEFFTLNHSIATPAGWSLTPPVAPALLAERFQLNEGDILLFHTDETCELIDASGLAQASRSAVRETATALAAIDQ